MLKFLKKMKVSRVLEHTLIDYPGKIAVVVFTSGCNFKCPACYSKPVVEGGSVINEEKIFSYLDSKRDWIDGVVICGGEPTIQPDLPDFIRQLKQQNLAVKLDTNGSNPNALEKAIESGVDYVAMDVKAPPKYYSSVVGADSYHLRFSLSDIENSMRILTQAKQEKRERKIDYELRTTIVPVIRNNNPLSWITPEEAVEMAGWIRGITGTRDRYILQPFVARTKEEMMDERFSEENLPQEMRETPQEVMQKLKEAVLPYLPNCRIRGES